MTKRSRILMPNGDPAPATTAGPHSLRHWEAAKDSRLNKAHWNNTGERINQAIEGDLPTLRQRAEYEIRNNGYARGVQETWKMAVVGENGPALQVQAEGGMNRRTLDRYQRRLEEVWSDWAEDPEINGQHALSDILNICAGAEWDAGEFLVQKSNRSDRDMPITLALNMVHPRRLSSSRASLESGRFFFMGIEATRTGKPIAYHIDPPEDNFGAYQINPDRVLAQDMIHGFRATEPGQMRGVPLLAPVLQSIADLRDYDTQVLDAARMAADFAVLLHSRTDDEPLEFDPTETLEIERRTMRALPPGYEATQLKPEQPTTQYVDYRSERLRELGRVANMPLLIIRLDSAQHNFSAARLDTHLFQRTVQATQAWFARRLLNPLVREVEREARFAGILPQRRPDRVKLHWTWPKLPSVDPNKEAAANETDLMNQVKSLRDIWAEQGRDPEEMLDRLKRTKEDLEERGLLPNASGEQAQGGNNGGVGNEGGSDRRELVRLINEIAEERGLDEGAADSLASDVDVQLRRRQYRQASGNGKAKVNGNGSH